MKLRYIVLAVLLVALQLSSWAQVQQDSVIFKAMKDELQRNKENLVLANYQKPFFIAYTMGLSSSFSIVASLGAVIESYVQPQRAQGAVELLIGDYFRTSDIDRNHGLQLSLPLEPDYNEIRNNFWLATDQAYKNALRQYASKQTFLKANPRSAELDSLADFTACEVKSHITTDWPEYTFDQKLWEERIVQLSAIFKKYPVLFDSEVVFHGQQTAIYKTTSENIVLKEPVQKCSLGFEASVFTPDGTRIRKFLGSFFDSPEHLPTMEELDKQITHFAEGLIRLAEAKPIDEYYSGPVMLEGSACSILWEMMLLKDGRLISWRPQEGRIQSGEFDGRIGRKILDSRLSIKNYTNLKSYNGKRLYGSYEVDAEGVVPPKETILVENGILKAQLNGRVPTLKAPVSTGSSRFSVDTREISFSTTPATVHIAVKQGMKQEKMKKELLKAAAEEGLDYAYIVREMGVIAVIYKVDVKTGQETQVRPGNEFVSIKMLQLKRLRAISEKEEVSTMLWKNFGLGSMICPSAIIVDDVEINKPNFRKEKTPALTFPLQR